MGWRMSVIVKHCGIGDLEDGFDCCGGANWQDVFEKVDGVSDLKPEEYGSILDWCQMVFPTAKETFTIEIYE